MKIRLTESQVKRLTTEGWFFNRRNKIATFQHREDYKLGSDTTIEVYEKGDEYLIINKGELGDEIVIKSFPKERFSAQQVIAVARDLSGEDNFENKRDSYYR